MEVLIEVVATQTVRDDKKKDLKKDRSLSHILGW